MKMILRKRFRKLIALFLLLVLFVPFISVALVSADPLPVQVPDFPYGQDDYYNANTDSFALWKVYGSDRVSYVQTRTNVFSSGAFPVVYRSGLSWTGYYYYIDYSKITDTWTKAGNHVDGGYSWTANIRVPAPGETSVNSEVYATLVYCNTDIYHGNGAGDNGIYAYQNFIVPSYADPTPIPTPTPGIDNKFPTFINAYKDNTLNSSNRAVTHYLIVNRYYDETNLRYEFRLFFSFDMYKPSLFGSKATYIPRYDGFDYISPTFTCYLPNIAPEYDFKGSYSLSYVHYDDLVGIDSKLYDCTNAVSAFPDLAYNNPGVRDYTIVNDDNGENYEATAIYLINSDGSTTRLDGQGGGTSATPTPTTPPTPIPQPSTTPEPEDPDKNSSWGWGIVNTLKYIFIPDKNKLIRLEKTTQTKFQQFGGGYDDLKYVSGFEDPVRPQNVVLSWHPFVSDSAEQQHDSAEQQQQITLVDFEQIDFYLFQTSSGMFICECLKASFTFLMFGYLIHVIRKHFVIENNTSEESDGGGD